MESFSENALGLKPKRCTKLIDALKRGEGPVKTQKCIIGLFPFFFFFLI